MAGNPAQTLQMVRAEKSAQAAAAAAVTSIPQTSAPPPTTVMRMNSEEVSMQSCDIDLHA